MLVVLCVAFCIGQWMQDRRSSNKSGGTQNTEKNISLNPVYSFPLRTYMDNCRCPLPAGRKDTRQSLAVDNLFFYFPFSVQPALGSLPAEASFGPLPAAPFVLQPAPKPLPVRSPRLLLGFYFRASIWLLLPPRGGTGIYTGTVSNHVKVSKAS